MPWKLDDSGVIVMEDGNPVYEHDGGDAVAVDAKRMFARIDELNRESAKHRRERNDAREKLELFSEIENPKDWLEEARQALKTVADLDTDKLKKADDIEKIRQEVATAMKAKMEATQNAMQAQIDELQTKIKASDDRLHKEIIGGSFSRSEFIRDHCLSPPDMMESHFGSHFAIEDGAMVARDSNGDQIMSQEDYGKPARFDEAIKVIVNAYPGKEHILRNQAKSGTGTQQGDRQARASSKVISGSDNKAFTDNIEGIIKGDVAVHR